MTRNQLSIRLEKVKIERIKSIAQQNGVTYADLIREKIDEIIQNGFNETTINKVQKLIIELRGSFAFVKTKPGLKRAKEERNARDKIATKLENIFNIRVTP